MLILSIQVIARLLPLSTPTLHFYTTFRFTFDIQYGYGRVTPLHYLQHAPQS